MSSKKKAIESSEQIKNELNTRKKVAIASLVVILALAIIGTVAWFIATQRNDFTGQNISVKSETNLLMSLDGENYAFELNLNEDETADGDILISDATAIRDLTGDGITLRRPALSQTGDVATPDAAGNWIEKADATNGLPGGADNGVEYISFRIWFKVDSMPTDAEDVTPFKVFLTNNSAVTPANESGVIIPADSSADGDTYNKSYYGTFSKDAIIGASRVAAYQDSTLKFVWIPRPDICLSSSIQTVNGSSTKVWTVTENNASSSEAYDSVHQYYDSTKTLQTLARESTIVGTSELPSSISPIAKATVAELTYDSTEQAYVGSAVITVWIEGTDREARRATAGGEFNVSLQFASYK